MFVFFKTPKSHVVGLLTLLLWSNTSYAASQSRITDGLDEEIDNSTIQTESRVFEPSYFERFSPQNALDMLLQIPGLRLQSSNGGNSRRGFGQANENVLLNGARLSSKSDSAQDQLRRIPAEKVIRIEILDGSKIDVPGFVGLVANVIVQPGSISGQFRLEGSLRTNGVDPELYGGELSFSGKIDEFSFVVAVENNNRRFGGLGSSTFKDGLGRLIESRDLKQEGSFDLPRISAFLTYDFLSGTRLNLNGYLGHTFFKDAEEQEGELSTGVYVLRQNTKRGSTPEYEVSGDINFNIGSSRLKLIGLASYDADETISSIFELRPAENRDSGERFIQTGAQKEKIGRAEYNWSMLGADWQLSGEAAFNRLERDSQLFKLSGPSVFTEVPFPSGSGNVTEDRYEMIASLNRILTPELVLQASIGGEYSRIRQTGNAANSRSFWRPKGSMSLAWTPSEDFNFSLGVERRVGQLQFGDFLANLELDENNENSGNNQLVPSQTWEIVAEISKTLGEWGTTTLMIEQRYIDDYLDVIPLTNGQESLGNIEHASRTELEWITTLFLDKIGWTGAKAKVRFEYEEGKIQDPVTGILRDFSGGRDREFEIDLRHDVQGSNFAYGGNFRYERNRPSFRISQIKVDKDLPLSLSFFLENKDILGTTVKLELENVLGDTNRKYRTIFDGPRGVSAVLLSEREIYKVGPIFRFSISGSF